MTGHPLFHEGLTDTLKAGVNLEGNLIKSAQTVGYIPNYCYYDGNNLKEELNLIMINIEGSFKIGGWKK